MLAVDDEPLGFSPIILCSLLAATKSANQVLYRNLTNELRTSIERLEKLSESGRLFGNLPLSRAVELLKAHPSYDKITTLAGMEAFSRTVRRMPILPLAAAHMLPVGRFARALNESVRLLNMLSARKCAELRRSGSAFMLEIENSPFASGSLSVKPQCSFYCGFLKAATSSFLGIQAPVEEASCRSTMAGISVCTFIIARV